MRLFSIPPPTLLAGFLAVLIGYASFSGNNLASSDCRRSLHCTNLWLDDGAGAGNGRQYADSDIMVSRTCSHRMVNAWRGFVGHRDCRD
ncbi:benzoate transporter [Escherichia coli]|nr:benzoate transporter [Escherichia coli]